MFRHFVYSMIVDKLSVVTVDIPSVINRALDVPKNTIGCHIFKQKITSRHGEKKVDEVSSQKYLKASYLSEFCQSWWKCLTTPPWV